MLSSAALMLALCVGMIVGVPKLQLNRLRADPFMSHIELSNSTEVVAKEEGAYHQVDIRNNKIDIVGYEATSGKFASIKKATHGSYVYNGMVYNRSAINGFETLKVIYSGGTLHYVFSDFLMENMDFDGPTLTSGDTVDVPSGKAYFIVYNESETKVDIESMDIGYLCDHSIDNQMIHWNGAMGGARSLAKRTTEEDSFIELENNPTKKYNNYSVGAEYQCKLCERKYEVISGDPVCPDCAGEGNTQVKVRNFSWYRWNGRYLNHSDDLGTEFTFAMTIIGEYSRMTDPSKYFHYGVWPQIAYGDGENYDYVQTYIGNDNYEPLGKAAALHPDDPLVNESYTGRFFSDYGYYDGTYKFPDPDTTNIADGISYRDAYEAYELPFWFVKFHVFLDGMDANCDVYINGMHIFTQNMFDDYEVSKGPLYIKTLPMHVVNYGIDAQGNPAESYTGTFTKPRLIEA